MKKMAISDGLPNNYITSEIETINEKINEIEAEIRGIMIVLKPFMEWCRKEASIFQLLEINKNVSCIDTDTPSLLESYKREDSPKLEQMLAQYRTTLQLKSHHEDQKDTLILARKYLLDRRPDSHFLSDSNAHHISKGFDGILH